MFDFPRNVHVRCPCNVHVLAPFPVSATSSMRYVICCGRDSQHTPKSAHIHGSRNKWDLGRGGWRGSPPVEPCRRSSALYSAVNMAQEKRRLEEERTDLLQ